MNENYLMDCDSYKAAHWLTYPPNTTSMFSYIESRGDESSLEGETVFFGLQYFLKAYLGYRVSVSDVEEAGAFFAEHGEPFNYDGWMYIAKELKGKLPVRIRAVPEGTTVPTHNILVSIESTDPKVFWIASWLETMLMRYTWYGTTVATRSYRIKKMIMDALIKTSDDPKSEIGFKLHDFGSRGVSSQESAMLGGAAHLVNFFGSDTVVGVRCANKYYHSKMAGFSIPASEHSSITSWDRNHELDAYRNMLKRFAKPGATVAIVSDSYDLYNACEHLFGEKLKQEIIDSGATIVIRPDCYDDQTEILTKNGWKMFSSLLNSDLVAQYRMDKTIEFVKPIKYVEQDYTGDMIHLYNDHRLDLMITPNHRVVYEKRGQTNIEEAQNIASYWNKNIPRVAPLPDKKMHISPFERFLVAFQADGSFQSNYEQIENPGIICGHITTRFNFVKKRKEKRLINICEQAGFKYRLNTFERRKIDQIIVYVEVPLKHKLSKHFIDWVHPSDRDLSWCREFIDEVSYWDATRRTETRTKYDSTIASNSEIVQLASIFAGYGCCYSIHKDERKDIFNDIHALTICANTRGRVSDGQSTKKEVVKYNGKVYCVQVPSGMIVVRRNRRVSVSGNSGYPPTAVLKTLQILDSKFGSTLNKRGYKVLNNVRVIQGDGINEGSIKEILDTFISAGYSASNVAFGMGGQLLQGLNRDTWRFAMKCSSITVDGVQRDVFKDPITDTGKKSKRGRLDLIKRNGQFETAVIDPDQPDQETYDGHSEMRTVWLNGDLIVDDTFDTIRERANL